MQVTTSTTCQRVSSAWPVPVCLGCQVLSHIYLLFSRALGDEVSLKERSAGLTVSEKVLEYSSLIWTW
jgi:hypothetical protein